MNALNGLRATLIALAVPAWAPAWAQAVCPQAAPDFGAGAAALPACAPMGPGQRLVTNFQTLSIEIDQPVAAQGEAARVRFRPVGGGRWGAALDLWHDPRAWSRTEHNAVEDLAPMWRGGVVGLSPGTAYEVEVLLDRPGAAGDIRFCGVAATRSDVFPVAAEIVLPDIAGGLWAEAVRIEAGRDGMVSAIHGADGATLATVRGGGPDGYVLVTGGAVVGGRDNVVIDAPYVILRGLTLRDAAENGVRLLSRAHDVVIERNEITGFGDRDGLPGDDRGEGFAVNWRAGVFAEARPSRADPAAPAERLTIQDNRIHTPRWDANAWRDWRPGVAGANRRACAPTPEGARPAGEWRCHPEGAHGIVLRGAPRGQNVIRRNRIWSAADRMFNDAMSGQVAIDAGGFPGPNSDVHDNVVSHFQDDGLEIDNGGRNVRVWGNVVIATPDDDQPLSGWKAATGDAARGDTRSGLSAISAAPVALGPLYVFRNVLLRAEVADVANPAVKQQGWPLYRAGRQYWMHNVIARDPATPGARSWAWGFLATPRGGEPERLQNLWIIANAVDAAIFAVQRPDDPAQVAGALGPTIVQANTVNGLLMQDGAPAARWPDANLRTPRERQPFAFAAGWSMRAGPTDLQATTIDRAPLLPTLNDCWDGGFAGAGPDIGAGEARP